MVRPIGPIVAKKGAISKFIGIDDEAIGRNTCILNGDGYFLADLAGLGQRDVQAFAFMSIRKGCIFKLNAAYLHPFSIFGFYQIQKKSIAGLFEAYFNVSAAFDPIGIVFKVQAESVVLYVQNIDLGIVSY
jgi:hypothetical protein